MYSIEFKKKKKQAHSMVAGRKAIYNNAWVMLYTGINYIFIIRTHNMRSGAQMGIQLTFIEEFKGEHFKLCSY